jgi:hypothetical protein
MTYDCPGITMQQPKGAPFEGYVACYRAGHTCPPFVALRTEGDTHIHVSYRCPCCGAHGMSMSTPREWGEPPSVPDSIRAGILLDADGAVQS